jgi:hypothetical protein
MARTTQENRLRGATAAARKSARTAVVQARTRARTQVRGVRGERCERVIMLHHNSVLGFSKIRHPKLRSSLIRGRGTSHVFSDFRKFAIQNSEAP